MQRLTPTQLDALAHQVAPTFPAADDATLARALLRQLGHGAPVTPAELCASSRLPAAIVDDALRRWPNVQRDGEGAVIGFAGLSLSSTPHQFLVGDRRLYAWCAWDTLFLPALLDTPARVSSSCPITGQNATSTSIRPASDTPRRLNCSSRFQT